MNKSMGQLSDMQVFIQTLEELDRIVHNCVINSSPQASCVLLILILTSKH